MNTKIYQINSITGDLSEMLPPIDDSVFIDYPITDSPWTPCGDCEIKIAKSGNYLFLRPYGDKVK